MILPTNLITVDLNTHLSFDHFLVIQSLYMTVKPWKVVRNLKLQPLNSALTLLHSEYVHMRGEMNSNWYEISFRLKILFRVQSVLYLCSHKLRQNENQAGMVFILDILTEMKFQTGEIFITTKFTQSKMNKHKLFGYCIYNACAFETHCSHFARNEISFRVIKYQVKTTWDKMHTDIRHNIRWFWNTAKMKGYRTCFPAGWKSEIGMSSFSFSEPTLKFCIGFYMKEKTKNVFFQKRSVWTSHWIQWCTIICDAYYLIFLFET